MISLMRLLMSMSEIRLLRSLGRCKHLMKGMYE